MNKQPHSSYHPYQWLAKLPLWVLLTVPFIVQLLGTVGLVGYLSYRSGQKSVNDLANQLVEEVGDRVNLYLKNYLETPQLINRLNANAIQFKSINLQDPGEIELHFIQQIQAFNAINRIHFSNPQGGFVSSGVDHRGLTIATTDQFQKGTLRVYSVDKLGNRQKLLVERQNYDATQRPFYRAAIAAGKPTWSSVYTYIPASLGLGIAASYPVYDNQLRLQGVLSTDLTLTGIDDFLQKLQIGTHGKVLIIDRSGQMIAASVAEPSINSETQREARQLKAIESQEPLIRQSIEHLQSQFNNLASIRTDTQLNFTTNGQRQFLQVAPFTDQYGLDWLIVTVVPESDFMAEINANNQRTLLLCGLTLLLASCTGILTARWIAKPIRRLQRAADAMTQGKFVYLVKTGGVAEIAQLAEAFQKMAHQIDISFQSLKASEERFALLLKSIPVGISIFDASGNAFFINQAGETIVGQASASESLVTPMLEPNQTFIAGTDQPYPIERSPITRALKGETAFIDDLEIEINGRRIPLEVHTIPVFDNAGNVLYAINAFQDITARRQIEQIRENYNRELEQQIAEHMAAIRQNEFFLWNLAETLPGHIYSLVMHPDNSIEFEYINRAVEQLHEVSLEHCLENPTDIVFDQIHPDDRPAYMEATAHSARTLTMFTHEWRIITTSGKLKWLRATAQPEKRENGDICWYGVVIDITDRKQAEDALRQRESLIRAILNAIPDLIIRMHQDGTYLDVKLTNSFPMAITIAAVGKNVREILPPEIAELRLIAAEKALQTGEIQVYDFPFLVQGMPLWQEARVMPLNTEEVLVVIRDLTERKQAEQALRESEERFRKAFDDAPIGIALLAPDGHYLRVNRSLCEIVGYTEAELLAITFQAITHPEDVNQNIAGLQQILADKIRFYQTEKRYLHKQGNIVQVSLNVSLVKDHEGEPLYFITQIQDVSDRHKIDRMKDEFISIVSHELRTPLTAIRGSLGILESGVLDDSPEQVKEMLHLALNNSDRLTRLVNDILDLERLESGKVQLDMQQCNAATVIQQAVESVQTIANEALIHLSVIAPSIQMWANPDAIVQTLTNLLSNAIKFSLAGSTVWVKTEVIGEMGEMREMREIGEMDLPSPPSPPSLSSLPQPPTPNPQPPTPSLLFSITDQGRGIPAAKLATIFERFQQVDVSDSRQKGGTGLGLAICRSIVQQHKGQIWAESDPGKGSTFCFTIPLSPHTS